MILTAAILFFTLISTTLALAGSLAAGTLTTSIAWASIFFGALAAGGIHASLRKRMTEKISIEAGDAVLFFLFLLFCLREFLWIYFDRDGAVYTLDTHNLGDLPLHLTYIANFANGTPFWPADPLFTNLRLHYPFGMDLFAALFLKIGVPLKTILPATGLVFGILTLVTLFYWGRGLAVSAFLFSGSVAASFFSRLGIRNEASPFLAWKNIGLALMIPQRGFLLAFPAGLLLLWSWRRRLIQNREGLPIYIEGLMLGLLPLFHLHSFLFLGTVLFIWSLWTDKWRQAFMIYGIAFIPATLEILGLTDFFRMRSILWIKPGWIMGKDPILFFLANFNLYPFLILLALFWALRHKKRESLMILLPAIGFFVLLFFVMFSPWEWDNTKLFVWCYLLMLPPLQKYLEEWHPTIRRCCYMILFVPSVFVLSDALSASNRGVEVLRYEEFDPVCRALRNLPAAARVAAAPVYNHPVALCGHKLVEGYAGQLWSHGIDYAPVEHQLTDLMMGAADWRKRAREIGADYLFWGSREQSKFKDSARPWEKVSQKIAEGNWGKLYKLDSV